METCRFCNRTHRVGFVSMRFAGTDGVSLETEKWASVLEKEGFEDFYFAGELDRPAERSYLVEEAHFQHPAIKEIHQNSFNVKVRARFVTQKIYELKRKLKDHLYRFIHRFNIDLLIPENALTIPLNLPLGMAIAELISETGIPTIAHHHDFFWERQALMSNAVWEYLNMAFPPHIPSMHHVVINSSADNQLSLRTGISATLIPNVMDFEHPPRVSGQGRACGLARQGDGEDPKDDYARNVRKDLGIADDELLILQPTRVVKRKGIEHAIELVNRLGLKAKLVISHASGDEGYDYEQRIRDYSDLLGVNTLFVSDIINHRRGQTPDGRKVYTLYDIYPHADLVTYPSNFEGFGNAFLEAVYFCKPIVVNSYSIYAMDIKPKGFSAIEIDGYVSEQAVEKTRRVLTDQSLRERMAQHNYEIARQHYSFRVLRRRLRNLLPDCLPCRMQE
ncbi:MAG: glycosyltransferase family 4 protein [Desulfobacterales bacterium]|nr:glycosyltransferase family 4 protein [Desulfobacterales bacterium]